MSREATVMGALAGSAVPVPHIVGLCRDKDVLGAGFYVMDKLVGRTLRTAQDTATLTPEQRGALTESMLDTLVALHEIDPADVRSEERRVGKECDSPRRSRRSTYH